MAGPAGEVTVVDGHAPYPHALCVKQVGQLGHLGVLALVPAPWRRDRLADQVGVGHGVQGVDQHLVGCVDRPDGRLAVQDRIHDGPDDGMSHPDLGQADRLFAGQSDLQQHFAVKVVETDPVSQLGVTLTQFLLQDLEVHVPAEGGDDVTRRERQGGHSCRLDRERSGVVRIFG